MKLIPNASPVTESNDCHAAADGRFCATPGSAGVKSKLTRTQTELVDLATRNRGHVSVEFGVQARRRFGRRKIAAANALLRQGVFKKVASDTTPLYKRGYGQNGFVVSATFALTK